MTPVTIEGLKLVLKSCPLRELRITGLEIQWNELTDLLLASSTLLNIQIDVVGGLCWASTRTTDEFTDNEIKSLSEALIACNGRVIVNHWTKLPNLPRAIKQRQAEVARIVRKRDVISFNARNVECWENPWEDHL